MEAAVGEFAGPEGESDGLGPVFNASGCGECHIANPVFGATSQITETRAGMWQNGQFTDHPGGSLIHSRTLPGYYIKFQERVNPSRANVIAIRNTISVLGDGFVEAIDSSTLQAIVNAQPPAQRGQLVNVPVLEEPGQNRFGRFGHKAQQASLLSFSADAYVNEMGITSPMQLDEPSSNGVVVDRDPVPGMDDEGVDVALFALFMRSTKAPPVDTAIASTTDARRGSQLFDAVGCAVCHTRTIVTAPPGTRINGGALKVANALGNKIIHPFSDYALHDVGTGDGIVQNGGPTTRNKIRTTALWGLRARGRFMHDNLSLSFEDAIARHGNQGAAARAAFGALTATDRRKLLRFLSSL
ncbi:MAG TPA: di-heme oxidoredictase family protein [Vicinamibacteria bacterium]